MNRTWILIILALSLILLSTLKTHELVSLRPFIKGQPSLKIQKFADVKKNLPVMEQELVELWESILTGRSAPLARWMKDTYSELGLKHVFTPSGFHLSAVLSPFLKLSSSIKVHLGLLTFIGLLLCFTPGFGALKRMVLIKGFQKLSDKKFGFGMALILDILFGSFQESPLSFSYSFLFLGIIYSGVKGIGLIFWFFICQLILAYFQMSFISPLLLIWSPILNLALAIIMPILFVLAIPLWNWQLHTGIFLLGLVQKIILFAAYTLKFVPTLEIHMGVLILVIFFVYRKFRWCLIGILICSNSLNMEHGKIPSAATYEFKPQTEILRVKGEVIYFRNGKCKLSLVQGFWWEKCSPLRRSTRKKFIS